LVAGAGLVLYRGLAQLKSTFRDDHFVVYSYIAGCELRYVCGIVPPRSVATSSTASYT
jgi:hypothetical protein